MVSRRAAAVGAHGRVEGVDASPEMVAYATRRARHLPNCWFRRGTAESLPYPDGHFDVVVSAS
jgi:ubiquinone/menaquinone biosynthesis C-methylase UbiE